jgi:hypothetical protein
MQAPLRETTAYLAAQLRQRFAAAKEAQKRSKDSVAAGRDYVARYVEFVHYVEQLHGSAPMRFTRSPSIGDDRRSIL